jgi:hypothetical protein
MRCPRYAMLPLAAGRAGRLVRANLRPKTPTPKTGSCTYSKPSESHFSRCG